MALRTQAGTNGGETTHGSRSIPPDVLRVLREFSTAIGSHTTFSKGHPALELVAHRLRRVLEVPLAESSRLTITVRRDYLEVDDAATDPSDLLLSGVASRLDLHRLHSLTFARGVQPDELTELLEALSQKVGHEGDPLGLAPDEELTRWPHIEVLRDDPLSQGAGDQGVDDEEEEGLWMGLDSAPFFTEVAGRDLVETESKEVADAIEAQLGDERSYRMIAVQIFRLAEDLKDASGKGAEIVAGRMSELVRQLEPDTLAHLLQVGDEGNRTNPFLRDSSEWMESDAIIELLRVEAENRQDAIVPRLVRLTTKLARLTSPDDRPFGSEADSAIRAIVRRLIEEWDVQDRRPRAHTRGPARSKSPPASQDVGEAEVRAVQPARTVKMCIELDLADDRARRASARLVSAGEAATLLDLLEHAPDESRVAVQLWRGISTPRALRKLLEAERPDFDVLDRIIEHVGLDGVEAMLDVLARSKRRSARQYLLEQISGMGPEVGPRIAELLHDRRWYVVRNMLRLLSSLGFWPRDLDIAPYLEHNDPRVRVEALRLAAGRQDHRDGAICLALRDEDQRVVTAGLAEASVSCPPAAEQILARYLRRRDLPEELRVQTIRALGTLESRGALRAIAGACVRRRWVFGRQLAREDSLVHEGVSQLAKRWSGTGTAKSVLRLARQSGDPDLIWATLGGHPGAVKRAERDAHQEAIT